MKFTKYVRIVDSIALLPPEDRRRLMEHMKRFCPDCGRVKDLWSHFCESNPDEATGTADDQLPPGITDAIRRYLRDRAASQTLLRRTGPEFVDGEEALALAADSRRPE